MSSRAPSSAAVRGRRKARIVARMVREFGPFFVKMAQVAAANADFLPEEIARELAVFLEDVAPMSAREAREAIVESFGEPPEKLYFGFDPDRPLRSGSIGSVYLARKPVASGGEETLRTIVVKVARHNLDREFLMGKAAVGLMLLSSHYWAPHGKLAPFLKAMVEQIAGFIDGFRGELQFEREAEVRERFWRRSRHGSVWRVPRVYRASERVVGMEFVEGAVNIARAVTHFAPRDALAYRRDLARKFVYTVLAQALVHREIHGDLHPGNVLVDAAGRLHLIDWGNAVELWREGGEGLLRRVNLFAHLLSNTQHLGLVVHADYLHLSRSIAALLGTLVNLYQGVPRRRVVADLIVALHRFPALALQDALRVKRADLAEAVGTRAAAVLPRPGAAARRVAPA